MSDRGTKQIRQARSTRLTFPDDESRQAWLPLLLEAYAIVDAGINEATRREEAQGRTLACHKGCAACCRSHTTIPIYPLELIGINWYVVEKITAPVREQLKQQLRDHKKGEPCPLLVDNACAVHPLRPMACRQFNVFGTVCTEGEDAYYTRRQDVLTPIRDYTDEAFDVLLLFYGIKKSGERKRMIQSGEVHCLVKVLQVYDWPKLGERMQVFDDQRATCS
ncbi:MAG TPA: YkgJ family cysteine cluster protein [Acidiferrobacterales bacterium]|nr:YkgJ family cysteine cluster protein [Acidiferrobacterales bacterium]